MSRIRTFNSHLNFIPISSRLILSSAVLTIFLVLISSFATNSFMEKLMVQEQVDFELNAFNQAGNYMNTIFDTVENCMTKVHNSTVVESALSSEYDSDDITDNYHTTAALDHELGTIFWGSDYLDNFILLGENGVSYIYTPDSRGDTLKGGYQFDTLLQETHLSNYIDNLYSLFYYTKAEPSAALQNSSENLAAILDNKLILLYLLKDNTRNLHGIAIVVMDNAFMSNSLSPESPGQNLYLVDNKNAVIWQDTKEADEAIPFSSDFISKDSDSSILRINNKSYLAVYDAHLKDNLILSSLTPLSAVYSQKADILLYTAVFGLLNILFVVIITFFFSKFITAPIARLSDSIKKEAFAEKGTVIPKRQHRILSISIKKKLVFYYLICVIIPNLLFTTAMSYFSYTAYKQKITDFTSSTISLVSTNINYKLEYLNAITEQLIYSDDVQNMLTSDAEVSDFAPIEKNFLNAKSALPEFLSFDLYTPSLDKIYSNIYFQKIVPYTVKDDMKTQLENSKKRLIFLETSSNLTTNSVLNFAREVYGKDRRFGQLIAVCGFTFDEDYLNTVIRHITLGGSGYLFITDQNGRALSSENNSLTELFVNNVTFNPGKKTASPFSLTINNETYTAFTSPENEFGFCTVGLIPDKDIFMRLSPVLIFNFIFLIFSILLILIASAFISSTITVPIKRLKTAMGRLQANPLSGNCQLAGTDEIAILTSQFNEMTERLHILIAENYQSKLRQSELQLLEKEAQFKALQQQINPHFLYNTLESIKWMAYKKGAMDICDMTTALGRFYRGSVSKGKDTVAFDEELTHLKSYIYIQQLRFPEKLEIKWDIPEEVLHIRVVKLILQPIVENSINHGIEDMESGAVIVINACILENKLCITISDNGIGMTQEQLIWLRNSLTQSGYDKEHESIGLKNVYRRLLLHYGDSFSFEIQSTYQQGTYIKIVLPYED